MNLNEILILALILVSFLMGWFIHILYISEVKFKQHNLLDECFKQYRIKLTDKLDELFNSDNKDIDNISKVFCIYTALITISVINICYSRVSFKNANKEEILRELDSITDAINNIKGKHNERD